MTGVRRVEQHPAGLVFNQRGLLLSPHPHHHHATQLVCAGSGFLHWLVPVLGSQLHSRGEEKSFQEVRALA